MLAESQKNAAVEFLHTALQGKISLKFSERFDEKSKIWNFKPHSHPYLELIYFWQGKARVKTSGNTIDVAFFDLLAYPPGVMHTETLDDSSHNEIVCLWLELPADASLPFSFKLSDDDGVLGWLCHATYINHLHRQWHYSELEDHLLKSLILYMEQKLLNASPTGSAAFDRSKAFIDEHYAENFTMDELAKIACVSPSYLSRLYGRHLGTSPMQYRNAMRVEKAKHLLLVKQASVEEIADILGFSDTKYFSQLFKSLTAMTPTQFRRKYHSG